MGRLKLILFNGRVQALIELRQICRTLFIV
jgi:hypothetical protein